MKLECPSVHASHFWENWFFGKYTNKTIWSTLPKSWNLLVFLQLCLSNQNHIMASGVTCSSKSIWSLNEIFYFKRQNLNKTMTFWIWAVQCTPFCLNLIHFCLCKFVMILVICERSFTNRISSLIHIAQHEMSIANILCIK